MDHGGPARDTESRHFFMSMLLGVRMILGASLALMGTLHAYYALWFRLEGSDELRWIEQVDLALGFALALAFVLLFAPGRFGTTKAWILTAVAAGLIWVFVSGSLIWWHREQHRIRSAPWMLQAVGIDAGGADMGTPGPNKVWSPCSAWRFPDAEREDYTG